MFREMANPTFRAEQWAQRYSPHVEPLNRLIDQLPTSPGEGVPPYIPPHYRPDRAIMIGLLSDPGPRAGGAKGSGFISYQNNDQTAERLGGFITDAGVDPNTVVPWNAYPWFSHESRAGKAPTVNMLKAGVSPLRDVLDLVPTVRAIVAFGRVAVRSLDLFNKQHPTLLRKRGIATFATYHPSRQALHCQMGTPELNQAERDRREEHIREAIRMAAQRHS